MNIDLDSNSNSVYFWQLYLNYWNNFNFETYSFNINYCQRNYYLFYIDQEILNIIINIKTEWFVSELKLFQKKNVAIIYNNNCYWINNSNPVQFELQCNWFLTTYPKRFLFLLDMLPNNLNIFTPKKNIFHLRVYNTYFKIWFLKDFSPFERKSCIKMRMCIYTWIFFKNPF